MTLLGGLIVATLTLFWQDHSAQQQRERIRQTEILEQKRGLISELANRFTTSMYYAWEYKTRELWIREVKDLEDKGTYRDGVSYEGTQRNHKHAVERYLESGSSDALCAQVLAVFTSAEVTDRARELDGIMDEFTRATTRDDAKEARYAAIELYQELLEQMGKELREVSL